MASTWLVAFANANGVSVAVSDANNITFGAADGTLTASASFPSQTSLSFVNANGVSFGVNGSTVTASIAAPVVQTSLSFANGNGVTFGLNASTLTASVAAQSSLVFSNANNVSFGIAGSTITATAGAGGGAAAISAAGSSQNAGTIVFSNSNNVSFGMNGSTVTASAAAGGGAEVTVSSWAPWAQAVLITGDYGNASLHVEPVQAPNVSFSTLVVPVYFSGASNSTATVSYSYYFGIYTRNASTLSLASSISTSGTINHSGNVNASINNGVRLLTLPWTSSLASGSYWLAINRRSSTSSQNVTLGMIQVSEQNSNFSGMFGVSSAASRQLSLGLGIYSASTSGMPASIAFSQLNGTASAAIRPAAVYFQHMTA